MRQLEEQVALTQTNLPAVPQMPLQSPTPVHRRMSTGTYDSTRRPPVGSWVPPITVAGANVNYGGLPPAHPTLPTHPTAPQVYNTSSLVRAMSPAVRIDARATTPASNSAVRSISVGAAVPCLHRNLPIQTTLTTPRGGPNVSKYTRGVSPAAGRTSLHLIYEASTKFLQQYQISQ